MDGSEFGREAVKYVLRHRDLFGANPQISLDPRRRRLRGRLDAGHGRIALPAYSEEDVRAMQKKAFESAVAPVRKLFQKAAAPVAEICLAGNAADEIAAYAKKRNSTTS